MPDLPNPPIGLGTVTTLPAAIGGIVSGVVTMATGNYQEGATLLAGGAGLLAAWYLGRSLQAKGIYEGIVDPALDEFQQTVRDGFPPDEGDEKSNVGPDGKPLPVGPVDEPKPATD